ncbi:MULTISPECIES: hypothetical protein [Actinoplanes]|uniref:hypothetical protein n=1 Tax=Actinoplanes TaxID=1865 RepID=UPI0009FA25D4|nr:MULTISPECIES: hypothetical protein [Actinoplanes]GLY06126.1 hypothetical protein Acsp01_65050 [Actinoplanes sp. NBRC 101535]
MTWKRGTGVADSPVIQAVEHMAERPSWDCRECGQSWPCAPARDDLAGSDDRIWLAMYMSGNLDQAMGDLVPASPAVMFDRFLGWLQQPARTGELVSV